MKYQIKLTVVLLFSCGFSAGGLFLFGGSELAKVSSNEPHITLPDNVALALRSPDEFSWALLAQISTRGNVNQQVKLPNGTTVSTNNALWETWADDQLTFPESPDPSNPPQWGDRNAQPKKLTNVLQQQLKILRTGKKLLGMKENQALSGLRDANKLLAIQIADGGTEEVRRNEAAFNFIVSNNLWYIEGLRCAFSKGNVNSRPNGKTINFPVDAIEIKAVWKKIAGEDKTSFHWNYDGKGTLYGLTGLHIISKTLPNWTWVTFEWVGNPGRCDFIGCHDSYGVTPNSIVPGNVNGKPSGMPYAAGTLTPDLLQTFQNAGFDSEWVSEWQNYRLKGSQVDFTDPTGVPNLVGNSIIENGFVQTSSCMTCHANASIDSGGIFNPTVGFTPTGQSLNGPVLPGWFYNLKTWDPVSLNYQVNYYQTDFIWAIFNAQNIKPGKPIPPCS